MNVYYVRMSDGSLVGNWPTRGEAEAAAARTWGKPADSVVEGPPPHDWKTCPCRQCRREREVNTALTTPCRFSP